MQQGQPGTPGKEQGGQQQAEAQDAGPSTEADSTWGQGAATALENLRSRDYRGRRSKPVEERPAAE